MTLSARSAVTCKCNLLKHRAAGKRGTVHYLLSITGSERTLGTNLLVVEVREADGAREIHAERLLQPFPQRLSERYRTHAQ